MQCNKSITMQYSTVQYPSQYHSTMKFLDIILKTKQKQHEQSSLIASLSLFLLPPLLLFLIFSPCHDDVRDQNDVGRESGPSASEGGVSCIV